MALKERWRDAIGVEIARGFVFSPVIFALGILLFFSARVEPPWWMLALCITLCLSSMMVLPRTSYEMRPLVWTALLLGAGFTAATWRSNSVAAPILDWRYYGPVEGRVIGLDRSGSGALRVTLDQVRLGNFAPHETPARVRVSLFGSDAEVRPRPGARVMTTAHLSPPSGPAEPRGFDFQRHAWFTQIGGLGYTRLPLLLAQNETSSLSFFKMRIALSERVQRHLSGQTGAFAAALMTGDRSGLSQDTFANLRHSNLAHLLAISGLHMGLLVGFVFSAIRLALASIPPLATGENVKKIAAIGGLIAAACYLGLSGGSVATERAFVMAAVALGAVLLERRAISLRAVALAALIILIRRPEAVIGPGFQMSFAATTALVITFNIMSARQAGKDPRHPVTRFIIGTVVSSAVAGLATLPIAAAHFNMISHFGLVANLVSVPLMGVLIIPLAVVAVILLPVGLEAMPLKIMGVGLDWILNVARDVSHWPNAISHVPAPPMWAFTTLCLGLLVLGLMGTKARFAGAIPICIACLGWIYVDRPDILISDSGKLIGIQRDVGRALNKPTGSGFVAGVWLENDGDAHSQEQAAAMWGSNPRATQVRSRVIYAASGKRGLAGFKGCARKDIVVFSEVFEGNAECDVFDLKRLRSTGSVALNFNADGTMEITTARAVAGRRYWNDRAVRRAQFGNQ